LRYEKIKPTIFQRILRLIGFLSATAVSAFIIIVIAYTYFDSPKEIMLERELKAMKLQYKMLNKDLEQMSEVLDNLEKRDDRIYRVIFEAEPIPDAVREAGYGGANMYKKFESYNNSELLKESTQKLEKLKKEMYIQSKSYDELVQKMENKEQMLASLPAIQPIYNDDLTRVASGYGYRIDPIYKTRKMHEGIDFTAPRGTEIYATGDGRVAETRFSRTYGRCVIVKHGYGYKTLYAHMMDVKVEEGDEVERGEVIGTVGSTGKSTAPHLHYEVRKNSRTTNPVNYFYNDLTPEQYEKLIKMASQHNQSFD
jgi:murein DD-endopeptidase MepM/ murein hydrolase activator NlpD